MSSPSPQLSLALRLRDDARFENFLTDPGSERDQAVGLIQQGNAGEVVYVWGAAGSGRTHLLEAACHYHEHRGLRCLFLPVEQVVAMPPRDVLDNLEDCELVCLANIQAAVGNSQWEQALFTLYNSLRERGHRLLISSDCAPQNLDIALADLKSRLSAAVVFRLPAYSDNHKREILQFRAQKLGLALSDEVASYLLSRTERTLAHLMQCLEQLDKASLAEKRRLTLPFVKQVFGW